MNLLFYVLAFLVGAGIAIGSLLLAQHLRGKSIIKTARAEGDAIKKAKMVEVKEKYLQLKTELDKQTTSRNAKLQSLESKLNQREKQLQSQEDFLVKKETELDQLRTNYESQKDIVEKKEQELDRLYHQAIEKLEKLATIVPTPTYSTSLLDNEQEYLDEYKLCLEEDGKISSKERRLLDRLRAKLGITEMRAKELEDSLNALKLTEEEQEYLEEYKLCLEEDGKISPKERRLLDRLRDKLSISQKRAKELEDFV
jgi:phage-related tail protein